MLLIQFELVILNASVHAIMYIVLASFNFLCLLRYRFLSFYAAKDENKGTIDTDVISTISPPKL